jgi:hypothetical protein
MLGTVSVINGEQLCECESTKIFAVTPNDDDTGFVSSTCIDAPEGTEDDNCHIFDSTGLACKLCKP